jgi:hypothetical protein
MIYRNTVGWGGEDFRRKEGASEDQTNFHETALHYLEINPVKPVKLTT